MSEMDDLHKQVQNHMKEIKAIQDANMDERTKTTGDRVIIWDFSSAFYKVSRKEMFNSSLNAKDEAIVIEDKLNIEYLDGKPDFVGITWGDTVCDLLLKYPDGTEVYCNSRHVKRVDKHPK